MEISLIAAMAHDRIIGRDNTMPWHLPADLKHFKAVTMGHPVIMGRLTYESIGKALPGRKNIVISRNKNYALKDAEVVSSCDDAIALASQTSDQLMVIGGGKIYAEFLAKAKRLYFTFIDLEVEGDTQFPDWTMQGDWKELSRQANLTDDRNPYDYTFVTLERTNW